MKTLLWVVVVAVIALVFFIRAAKKAAGSAEGGKAGPTEQPRRRQLLSEREQAMHHRLSQSLPELVILSQVSFGALLTARAYAVRNTFDRKTADFVVCDKAFQVLAVIELDDAGHKGKAARDGARDAMLVQAGYRVLRYANIPDIDRIRDDFGLGNVTKPVPTQSLAAMSEPASVQGVR
ncbi:DUF2726 domain-containing protein [Comamonas endophytica]|uniref:DUF2726 domain-containing protein n=1 Tax=Comamonas endophytica TaxID=2949090 RepID=A0ABY6GAT8_9BURK|nr:MULTISPECIES: DUF2726 domain-containing protein [unclassified Acidovorax]MCD2511884.1 DUF2726 domain-containing protein [Acidovorax sp. D4N7]UYG51604.1 DUF2726 domain-containing protein [Acidovorax sp. 5MLIR]